MSQRIRLPRGMTPARRTTTGYSSSVSLPLDEQGAFGRVCPNRDCLGYFKLFLDEYEVVRSRRWLACPACGHTGDDETFHTPEQRRRSKAAVLELAKSAAQEVIADFVRGQGTGTKRLGPGVSIRYNTNFPASRIPEPLPEYVERETLRTFVCPAGGHRAVIYDLLTACPYCGPDTPPRAVFNDNLAAMSRRLNDAETMTPAQKAAGEHTTAIEQALTRVVSACQNFAKQLHARAGHPPPADNPWQNVERVQKRWIADFGRDPLADLDATTVRTLRLAFARRHIIEHNGGVVDERYIKETGDGRLGVRVKLTPTFVRQAHLGAEAMADRLEATAA